MYQMEDIVKFGKGNTMKIKDRIALEVTLKCKYEYEKTYQWQTQYHTIYIMEDAEGQQYKWDTTGFLAAEAIIDEEGTVNYQVPDIGDKFMLKGTVKDFSEYKETPQVVLTRCKCLEITYRKPAKEEIEEQKKQKQLASLEEGDFIQRMPYRQYKEHYADCETVFGSYHSDTRSCATIEVIIRNGRQKASGVRGEHFKSYQLQSNEGNTITYRAVSEENAIKRACKEFPAETWECINVYDHQAHRWF